MGWSDLDTASVLHRSHPPRTSHAVLWWVFQTPISSSSWIVDGPSRQPHLSTRRSGKWSCSTLRILWSHLPEGSSSLHLCPNIARKGRRGSTSLLKIARRIRLEVLSALLHHHCSSPKCSQRWQLFCPLWNQPPCSCWSHLVRWQPALALSAWIVLFPTCYVSAVQGFRCSVDHLPCHIHRTYFPFCLKL